MSDAPYIAEEAKEFLQQFPECPPEIANCRKRIEIFFPDKSAEWNTSTTIYSCVRQRNLEVLFWSIWLQGKLCRNVMGNKKPPEGGLSTALPPVAAEPSPRRY
jgi:hypothetical protein